MFCGRPKIASTSREVLLRLDDVSWRRGQDTSVIEMEGERVRSVSVAERIGGIGGRSGFNAELMA